MNKGDHLTRSYENALHDIKIPMSAIDNYVQLLENYPKLDIKTRDYIRKIKHNWHKAMELIYDTSDALRIDMGVFKPKVMNYEINTLIKEIHEQIEWYLEKKEIQFEFNSNCDFRMIAIDRNMFERIMMNILSNAIKFTPKGGQIKIAVFSEHKDIAISIEDNGPGMKDDTLAKRYMTTDNVQGSGIGMSIIREFTAILGGTLEIGHEMQGSKIVLKFPGEIIENAEYSTMNENFASNPMVHILFGDSFLESRQKNKITSESDKIS